MLVVLSKDTRFLIGHVSHLKHRKNQETSLSLITHLYNTLSQLFHYFSKVSEIIVPLPMVLPANYSELHVF